MGSRLDSLALHGQYSLLLLCTQDKRLGIGQGRPSIPWFTKFLATGSSPTFSIGSWHNITIMQTTQNTITVYGDGILITTFTDTERPYTSGRIGLYDEDAHVQFQNIS